MTETASGVPAPTEVVTCFLRNRGDVLLVRRSAKVGTYRGRWGGVAGHVETDDPLGDAWREIQEETGLHNHVALVKRGEPFTFTDENEGRSWRVHPFLFDSSSREAHLDWEAVEGAWVAPTAILERDCVPRLWTSYARVAPTLDDVRADRKHGSTYLSLRALEVLRDRAAALTAGANVPGPEAGGHSEPESRANGHEPRGPESSLPRARDVEPVASEAVGTHGPAADHWEDLRAIARALAEAQPAMTTLRNRISRAMSVAERNSSVTAGSPPGAEALDAEAPGAEAPDPPPAAILTTAAASNTHAGGTGPAPSSDAGVAWARAVASAAEDTRVQALLAEDTVVTEAAALVAGRRVLTLSLSSTVSQALSAADPAPSSVIVTESQPGGEGQALAMRLAGHGLGVTLVPDAAVSWALAEFRIELVLVGADTVLPSGDVVNKVGTRPAALAARDAGVPFLVLAARDKIAAEGWTWNEASEGDGANLAFEGGSGRVPARDPGGPGQSPETPNQSSFDDWARETPGRVGEIPMRWRSPLFERTPAALITGVVTEVGVLDASGVRREAAAHRLRHDGADRRGR